MKEFFATTGYGYFKDENDHIVGKFKFTAGKNHRIDDNITVTELNTSEEVDAIECYVDPVVLAEREAEAAEYEVQGLINQKAKDMAQEALVADGTLEIVDGKPKKKKG